MAAPIWQQIEEFCQENDWQFEAEYLGKWFTRMDFLDSDDSRFVPATVLWHHYDFAQAVGGALLEAKAIEGVRRDRDTTAPDALDFASGRTKKGAVAETKRPTVQTIHEPIEEFCRKNNCGFRAKYFPREGAWFAEIRFLDGVISRLKRAAFPQAAQGVLVMANAGAKERPHEKDPA